MGPRAVEIVGPWKLVAPNDGEWELYDMQADRSELHDLAKEQPDRVKEMAELWDRSLRMFEEQSGAQRD